MLTDPCPLPKSHTMGMGKIALVVFVQKISSFGEAGLQSSHSPKVREVSLGPSGRGFDSWTGRIMWGLLKWMNSMFLFFCIHAWSALEQGTWPQTASWVLQPSLGVYAQFSCVCVCVYSLDRLRTKNAVINSSMWTSDLDHGVTEGGYLVWWIVVSFLSLFHL